MVKEHAVRAGIILEGKELVIRKNTCVWLNDGIIESIESSASCPPNSLGSDNLLITPQPALAHTHSMDNAFPEYGIDEYIDELVSYPKGEKHIRLSRLSSKEMIDYTREYYITAWRKGVGFIADFREKGGIGCITAKRAIEDAPEGVSLLVLGRPGPEWPLGCDGLGVSTPLDYQVEELKSIISKVPISATHIAETKEMREKGDLERALELGFDILIHGVFLSDEDIVSIAKKRKSLVLCLSSNMWHGLGLPSLDSIYQSGLSVGIGTDNASWFPPDPWSEARNVLFIGRLQGLKKAEFPKWVLRSLFIMGYEIYGGSPKIISEGKNANFLLWSVEGLGIDRAENVYAGLVKRLVGARLIARYDNGVLSWL